MKREPTTTLLRADPFPIWTVDVGSLNYRHSSPPFDSFELIASLERDSRRDLIGCAFRATSIERLPIVLRTGIDVEPSDSVFFAETFEKAWEYGGWPKLMLALDYQHLLPSFKEVPANTANAERAHLRQTYPTQVLSKDGSRIWLSRLKDTDPRVTSAYEVAYARWIPDDPLKALRAVVLFGSTDELMAAIAPLAR